MMLEQINSKNDLLPITKVILETVIPHLKSLSDNQSHLLIQAEVVDNKLQGNILIRRVYEKDINSTTLLGFLGILYK